MKKLIACTSVALLMLFSFAASADIYDDAVTNLARPEADRERDVGSMPAELMRFAGVQPGDIVIDLLSGGGYNAELLAAVVGSNGKVYMHNNAAYIGFAGDDANLRVAGGRLANVERVNAELESLPLADSSVDVIWINMSYHDAYWVNEGWTVTADTLFPALQRILKPGGSIIVIDHHAPAGTGISHVGDLHRIDAEFARNDFINHGFALVASSSILENVDDPLNVGVFSPEVQGKTSRFVYKFTR